MSRSIVRLSLFVAAVIAVSSSFFAGEALASTRGIIVRSAHYHDVDVRNQVQGICDYQEASGPGNGCDLVPTSTLGYDPSVGNAKRFTMTYTCGSDPMLRTTGMFPVATGASIFIPCNIYGGPMPPPGANVRIISATYHGNDVSLNTQAACDYFSSVYPFENRCQFVPSRMLRYDPAPGYPKSFDVVYQCGRNPAQFRARAYPVVTGVTMDLFCEGFPPIPPPPPARLVRVVSANYAGFDVTAAASRDCAATLVSAPLMESCSVIPSYTLPRDPNPGYPKSFRLTYRCSGDPNLHYADMDPVITGYPVRATCYR